MGETTAAYTGKPMDLEWKDYGIEMHIEKQDLPPGIAECPMTVSVAVSGDFEFPGSSELVSGVYKLDSSLVPSNLSASSPIASADPKVSRAMKSAPAWISS